MTSAILPKALRNLISEFEKLPGIGPKSAARYAYYLFKAPERESISLAKAAEELKKRVHQCSNCYNLSEGEKCQICEDISRDSNKICVVEEPMDVYAIEKSRVFDGVYHVLGGTISPVNSVGPDELTIKELLSRVKRIDAEGELLLATNPDLEGEATAMYISQKVKEFTKVKITRIARGLPSGADIEYADNITIKRSIEGRLDM